MAGALVGDVEVIMTIRFSTAPGTTPEKAATMLSQGGVNIPLGLVQHIREVNVNVVPATPPQEGGKPRLL